MQLTLGDLLIIEIAMANFLNGIDLSMQAGQQAAEIIGKLEYQIGAIKTAVVKQDTTKLTPAA